MKCLPRTARVLFALLLAAPLPGVTAEPTAADLLSEIERLRQQVGALEQRLDALQGEQKAVEEAHAVIAEREAAARDGAVRPEGPSVELGGRIKADLIWNSRSVGGPGGTERADSAFLPRDIPLTGAGERGQIGSSARDSRFWINARTPTSRGELGAYIELDFVSADGSGNEKVSNSYNPRMRHAYGTYGGVTAGQTYTTFLNVYAYPELSDAHGPLGILNVRQPLVRYQHETSNTTRWALALEQPETTLTTLSGDSIAPDDDQLPDVVARFDQDRDWGNWSLALLLRELRRDEKTASDRAHSAALSVAGRVYLSELDNVRFALAGGTGFGRYLSFNAFDDAMLDGAGQLHPLRLASGFVAVQHWWSPTLRTNVALGAARAVLPRNAAAAANEAYASLHLNLIWNPIPDATLGVEWLYARRERADDARGTLHRLQISSLYKF